MIEGPFLADALISLRAESLDDVEKVRIATNNRLGVLTRPADKTDDDGICRGLGYPEDHPLAMQLAALITGLQELEKAEIKHLEKALQSHPLYPWVKAQKGVGPKQGARLLAAVGDPYWNTLHDRPRTMSELWAYCGLSVIDGQVQARRKGQKSNWSNVAKMRVYLIAQSCKQQRDVQCKELQETEPHWHLEDCGCSPYRVVYDREKLAASKTVHLLDCKRCGPSGESALAGSPLSAGHQDARALRHTAKELLKDLYNEAKRLHQAA